jgi:hypothetical protein
MQGFGPAFDTSELDEINAGFGPAGARSTTSVPIWVTTAAIARS